MQLSQDKVEITFHRFGWLKEVGDSSAPVVFHGQFEWPVRLSPTSSSALQIEKIYYRQWISTYQPNRYLR